jgi:hypothetical protein
VGFSASGWGGGRWRLETAANVPQMVFITIAGKKMPAHLFLLFRE